MAILADGFALLKHCNPFEDKEKIVEFIIKQMLLFYIFLFLESILAGIQDQKFNKVVLRQPFIDTNLKWIYCL